MPPHRPRRRSPAARRLVWLAIFLAAAGAAAAPPAAVPPVATRVPADARFADMRQQILERVASGELPSVAVAVYAEGEVLWQEALGWADRQRRVPATPDTVYGLASLGKSVLATGMMVLVERGEVGLEAPVDRYLAPARLRAFESAGAAITVRQVLDMTAAIPHGWLAYAPDATVPAPAELVARHAVSVFPPGEVYLYSNLAYGVLELAIEKVSGLDYGEFLAREVFRPLGMTNASVGPAPAVAHAATGYGAEAQPLPRPNAAPRSSLGTWASLDDLLRYGRFHLGQGPAGQRPILSPASLRALHRERSSAPLALGALGWGSIELGDEVLWLLSNGRMGGFTSTLSLFPEQGVAVVCLANVSSGSGVTDELATAVAGVLVPGLLEKIQAAMEAYESRAYRPYRPGSELAGEWIGAVRTAAGQRELRLVFQPDGDVHVRLAGELPTLLDGVGWEEGLLAGRFEGPLLETAGPARQRITVGLRLAGEVLSGFAAAAFETEEGSFSLPSYVRLQRRREPPPP